MKGRFVDADGLGCALARAGKSFAVVHTGSAGSAYLVNHKAAKNGHWTFSIHGAGHTQTPEAVHEVVDRFGPLPESALPRFEEIDYGADVMVDHVLKARAPDVALIWFAEPDSSYHFRDIGSEDAVAITRRVDQQFGRILETIAAGPDADETMVIAMSDHGQIAVTEMVDVFSLLNDAGFAAADHPGDGIDVIASLAIALDITVVEKTPERIEAVATALMAHPGTGLLFSRSKSPEEGVVRGTLPFGAVGIDHARAADLVCVLRSSTEPDAYGLPGRACCTTPIDVALGGGMHGGLNVHEQNTMLAFGGAPIPALGVIDDPGDLTDIVPTLLDLMGVAVPESMTGKPLAAVTGRERPDLATSRLTAGHGSYQQQIDLATGGPRAFPINGNRVS